VVRGYDTLQAGVATLPFAVVTGAMSPVAIGVMKRIGTKIVVAGGLVCMSAGFVVAAGVGIDSAYWGPIIISMTLMAAGLALASSPATDAVMGAVLPGKAGAGSAVNDMTRELGGTLGVAVVGSVIASIYGPHVLRSLTSLGAPPTAAAAAQKSVVAGLTIVAHLPPALQGLAVHAARQAFVDGLSAGSLVAAAGTALAAAAALAFLPARAKAPRPGGTAAPVLIRTDGQGRVAAEELRLEPAEPPARSRPLGPAAE
jgi:hypothetical protein